MSVIVVGGGAAGLMACGTLAKRGIKVTLIEKNKMLGKKIRITGKGRCNITNIADVEDMINNVATNGSFLYSALYTFTNQMLIELLNSYGLETKVERGGRVFPKSDNAKDVVEALIKHAITPNTTLINKAVEKLDIKDGRVCGVVLSDGEKITADSVIIATGGKSYPLTGSTGDGYKLAKQAGHAITPLKPSLVPLETHEQWAKDLMGLSLKNVAISVKTKGKNKVYEDFGEMIFTHFGVSGPIILSASCHLRDLDKNGYHLYIDLKPALDENKLNYRILRDFSEFSRKQFVNSLNKLLPKRLIDVVVNLSGIDPATFVNQITKQQRQGLVKLLKGLPLSIKALRPIEEAIITSGGVNVKQIDPSTMESKITPGLYFAGEVIDVDAYTGGYNLQIAFSTGYLAGIIAKG